MLIVPKLDPVAKEIREAIRKIMAGINKGFNFKLKLCIRCSAVLSSINTSEKAQAAKRMKIGSETCLIPLRADIEVYLVISRENSMIKQMKKVLNAPIKMLK